jgi:hypothetical protein
MTRLPVMLALALPLVFVGACERRSVPPNVIPPGASQAKPPAATAAATEQPEPSTP